MQGSFIGSDEPRLFPFDAALTVTDNDDVTNTKTNFFRSRPGGYDA
jgi:hypothetical protein